MVIRDRSEREMPGGPVTWFLFKNEQRKETPKCGVCGVLSEPSLSRKVFGVQEVGLKGEVRGIVKRSNKRSVDA